MNRTLKILIAAALCASLFTACGGAAANAPALPLEAPVAGQQEMPEGPDKAVQETAGEPTPEEEKGFIETALAEYCGLTTDQLREKIPDDAIEQHHLGYLTEFTFPYTLYGVEGYLSIATSTSDIHPDGITDGLSFVARGVSFDIFRDAAREISTDECATEVGFYQSQPYQVGGDGPNDPAGLDQMGEPDSFDPYTLVDVQSKTSYDGTGAYTLGNISTYFGIRYTTEGCLEPYYDSFTSITGDAFPVFSFEVYLPAVA